MMSRLARREALYTTLWYERSCGACHPPAVFATGVPHDAERREGSHQERGRAEQGHPHTE